MTEEGGKKNWLPLESNPDVMNAVRLWGGKARAPRGLQWELVGVPSSGMASFQVGRMFLSRSVKVSGALAPSSPPQQHAVLPLALLYRASKRRACCTDFAEGVGVCA
jgi:hypothetical protein